MTPAEMQAMLTKAQDHLNEPNPYVALWQIRLMTAVDKQGVVDSFQTWFTETTEAMRVFGEYCENFAVALTRQLRERFSPHPH